jgi:hypothetical protein
MSARAQREHKSAVAGRLKRRLRAPGAARRTPRASHRHPLFFGQGCRHARAARRQCPPAVFQAVPDCFDRRFWEATGGGPDDLVDRDVARLLDRLPARCLANRRAAGTSFRARAVVTVGIAGRRGRCKLRPLPGGRPGTLPFRSPGEAGVQDNRGAALPALLRPSGADWDVQGGNALLFLEKAPGAVCSPGALLFPQPRIAKQGWQVAVPGAPRLSRAGCADWWEMRAGAAR